MTTETKREVTINADYFGPGDGVYVIPEGEGYSCLGFDVCLERIERYALELGIDAPKVERGTMQAYEVMRGMIEALRVRFERTDEKSVAELSPQLLGLEGWRVAVKRLDGSTASFIVGRSSGWMPVHLEIKRRDSMGGEAAQREYTLVEPIEKVR